LGLNFDLLKRIHKDNVIQLCACFCVSVILPVLIYPFSDTVPTRRQKVLKLLKRAPTSPNCEPRNPHGKILRKKPQYSLCNLFFSPDLHTFCRAVELGTPLSRIELMKRMLRQCGAHTKFRNLMRWLAKTTA
jgi:hypothetical protein